MRRSQKTLSAIGLVASMLPVSGCAQGREQVAGHQYDVPAANLIPKSSYPFFLPRSEGNEFIFVLNPQAELRERRNVLVQDRKQVCARANGSGYVSRTICGEHPVQWQGRDWLRNGDDTFWTYSPATPPGTDAPYVSCHKMEIKGHTGLCSATLALGDLALTIGINDDELPTLQATYERAVSMLKSWEL